MHIIITTEYAKVPGVLHVCPQKETVPVSVTEYMGSMRGSRLLHSILNNWAAKCFLLPEALKSSYASQKPCKYFYIGWGSGFAFLVLLFWIFFTGNLCQQLPAFFHVLHQPVSFISAGFAIKQYNSSMRHVGVGFWCHNISTGLELTVQCCPRDFCTPKPKQTDWSYGVKQAPSTTREYRNVMRRPTLSAFCIAKLCGCCISKSTVI